MVLEKKKLRSNINRALWLFSKCFCYYNCYYTSCYNNNNYTRHFITTGIVVVIVISILIVFKEIFLRKKKNFTSHSGQRKVSENKPVLWLHISVIPSYLKSFVLFTKIIFSRNYGIQRKMSENFKDLIAKNLSF